MERLRLPSAVALADAITVTVTPTVKFVASRRWWETAKDERVCKLTAMLLVPPSMDDLDLSELLGFTQYLSSLPLTPHRECSAGASDVVISTLSEVLWVYHVTTACLSQVRLYNSETGNAFNAISAYYAICAVLPLCDRTERVAEEIDSKLSAVSVALPVADISTGACYWPLRDIVDGRRPLYADRKDERDVDVLLAVRLMRTLLSESLHSIQSCRRESAWIRGHSIGAIMGTRERYARRLESNRRMRRRDRPLPVAHDFRTISYYDPDGRHALRMSVTCTADWIDALVRGSREAIALQGMTAERIDELIELHGTPQMAMPPRKLLHAMVNRHVLLTLRREVN